MTASRSALPSHARVVIIGGGIIGCSTAYHLARAGITDVVLLEQGQLSCGTTWHAAGLVGQLRTQRSLTQLVRYSTELYASLEAETGLATGWKRCGSLSVARTAERLTQLKRSAATARAYGVECELIDAQAAGELWPAMRSDDLAGAVWLPGDGKANPTDLTQSLARGARQRGVRLVEGVRVTELLSERTGTRRRASGVNWRDKDGQGGTLAAEIVVNCAGQWAKGLGRLAGVTVPLHSAEHYYIVTGRIPGVHPELPVMRDPDGYIYFKEEVGGLVMGGFEPDAKPWGMDGIPEDFEFQLLPDDWDQFEILMRNALHRVPELETAEVRQFYNGPESFTPDNHFILGEAPELANFFVGAGFNSTGIASAGGAGRALAEWIVGGEPGMDLWSVDIRRFARLHGNDAWLHDRVKETLGLHYAMPWPNRELDSARGVRRSPIHARLEAAGACFGSRMGWEIANVFAPPGQAPRIDYRFGRQNWHDWSAAEHRAAREGVALFDRSAQAKLLLKGRDAERALQSLAAADLAVAPGTVLRAAILNARGGYESDPDVARLADDQFLLVTGVAQVTRDLDLLERHLDATGLHGVAVDVTGQYALFSLLGPRSRALLQSVSKAALDAVAFPLGTMREIDLGHATVRALHHPIVGEPGWDLLVPVESALPVFDTLQAAGAAFGLACAGEYALESLRIENGRASWGRELSPGLDPFEAGLAGLCKHAAPGAFPGAAALATKAGQPCARRVVALSVDGRPDVTLWGGEGILRDGRPVGTLSSAAFGHTLGAPVALGVVACDPGQPDPSLGRYEIELAGERLAASPHQFPPTDTNFLEKRK
ncbi:GcvT family protein [Burkholderia gladioli]|uniref:GcvT family protein n=1 Tax=Burkholderia gladioli TaxID=28095 RepID=UPI00163EC9CD|nr:FAD-dependent oxidoreductase [Burkholderia gladioli]